MTDGISKPFRKSQLTLQPGLIGQWRTVKLIEPGKNLSQSVEISIYLKKGSLNGLQRLTILNLEPGNQYIHLLE
jgi:hypothetical protein